MEDNKYKMITKKVSRLIYLRHLLDDAIDQAIRDEILRYPEREDIFNVDDFKGRLDYIIDDAFIALKQNR